MKEVLFKLIPMTIIQKDKKRANLNLVIQQLFFFFNLTQLTLIPIY